MDKDVGLSAEIEPLGGTVPAYDPGPVPDETPVSSRPLGDIFRPESGCAWNGTRLNCEHLPFIINGAKNWQIQINIRSEGGWGTYNNLRSQVRLWRFNVYKREDITDQKIGDTSPEIDGEIQVNSNLKYVRTFYEFLVSPFWDEAISQTQTARYAFLHDAPKSVYSDAVKNLKPRVDKALTETCKQKLNELLGKLKSKTKDIVDLANKAYNGDGITLSLTDNPIEFLYKKGFSLDDKGTVVRAPSGATKNRNSIVINRNIHNTESEVLTFIHKLFHTAEKNSHDKISNAIANLEGFGDKLRNYKKTLENDDVRDEESSNLINSWIQRHCTQGVPGQWERNLKTIGVN